MDSTEYCTKCSKPFFYFENKMGVPGGKEKEPIDCPYCGETVRESMTDGWFRSSKMTDEQIEEYFKKNKKKD